MKKIKGRVFYDASYTGATIGAFLFSNCTVLVDAPLKPEDGRAWLAALRKSDANAKRILMNLDSHPDRTLGAETLDAQVMAHHETARQIRRRAGIFRALKQDSGGEWEETSGLSGLRWIQPHITFAQQSSLHFDGKELQIEAHPGPGPGACWLVSPKDKVMFIGDAIVLGQPPFLAQADIPEWLEDLQLLTSRQFKDYVIISGRGGKVTGRDINQQKKFLLLIQSRLNRFAKRKSTATEEINKFAVKLAEKYKAPARKRAMYAQRLKYGMNNYYTRHYLPSGKSQNNN